MNTEPVVTAASVAALISSGVAFARLMGWIVLDDEQFNALMVFVNLLLPIVAAMWARAQVTPLRQPRDVDGQPLTRPDSSPALKARRSR